MDTIQSIRRFRVMTDREGIGVFVDCTHISCILLFATSYSH
jgi:hypothetical protein